MAIVLNPALSMAASGDLGSINYSRWRSIMVARTKYTPVQPNTSAQQLIQGYFDSAITAWQTMTDDNRQLWRAYASTLRKRNKLQQEYIPNAYNVFVGMSILAQRSGESIPTVPPVEIFKYSMVGLDVYQLPADPGFVYIVPDTQPTGDATGHVQYWVAGGFESAGRSPQSNDWDLRNVFDTGDYWRTSFSDDGFYYYFRCRVIDDYGRASSYLYSSIQYSAT